MTDPLRNPLPNLGHRGKYHETALPLDTKPTTRRHRAPSGPLSKPILPGGRDLRELLLRRIGAQPQHERELLAGLHNDYVCRAQADSDILDALAGLLNGGLVHKRGPTLRIAENETVSETTTKPMYPAANTAPVREFVLSTLAEGPRKAESLWQATHEQFTDLSRHRYGGVISGLNRAGHIWRDHEDWWRLATEDEPDNAVPIETPADAQSETPPEYVVGDEDDGAIPDPPSLGRDQDEQDTSGGWLVFDTRDSWTCADTVAEARRLAEDAALAGHEAALFRRVARCKARVEWSDEG